MVNNSYLVLWINIMTKKQIMTLVLFAQNYSLQIIAKKQMVSLTTIRQRIKTLSKNYQREFNNALGIRESYKRTREGIRNCEVNTIIIEQY